MQDTIEAALERWAQAFAAMDIDALVDIHTDDALFFGSKPELKRGRDGVRDYFTSLPAMNKRAVRFEDVVTLALADNVTAIAGTAVFMADGKVRSRRRLTQTLVRDGGLWRVAQHHASPE